MHLLLVLLFFDHSLLTYQMINVQQLAERIRSREDLQKKQDKLNRKFENTPRPRVTERERALSPGYLEDALEEVRATHSCYLA